MIYFLYSRKKKLHSFGVLGIKVITNDVILCNAQ